MFFSYLEEEFMKRSLVLVMAIMVFSIWSLAQAPAANAAGLDLRLG